MSGRATIRVGFGKAVLSTSTTTFSVMRVVGPWNREPAATSGVRRPGTATKHFVGAHGDMNGTLYADVVEHEPGTFLLVSASKTVKGSPVSEGSIILRLRPGAAVLNVIGKLPPASENMFGTNFSLFQGNADILSVEEAELLGLRVPRGYVDRFFDPEEIGERFDVVEITPEVTAKPEFAPIITPSGVKVVEVAAAPTRRIKVRR